MVDKYTWTDLGSSYLPSELQAAYLYGQLQNVELINNYRLEIWQKYYNGLLELASKGLMSTSYTKKPLSQCAYVLYQKSKDLSQRTALIDYLKTFDIFTAFHYVPLHTSPYGLKVSEFYLDDEYTTLRK